MHNLFSDWYRKVEARPTSETLEARWEIIESLSSNATPGDIISYIKLFRDGNEDAELSDQLTISFKENDPTFPSRNNLQLLRILVGAVLINLMEGKKKNLANITALTIHCAHFSRKANKSILPDVLISSSNYLHAKALTLREINHETHQFITEFKDEDVSDPAKVTVTLKKITSNTKRAVAKLKKDIDILAEESNTSWWLLSEFSRLLGQPWSKLSNKGYSIFLGKDLAENIRIIPGPLSIYSLLEKANKKFIKKGNTSIKIGNAVNTLPRKYREILIEETQNLENENVIFPIYTAIKKSLETTNKNDWLPAFQTLTKINADEGFNPTDISFEFYQECLLVRELNNII